MNNIKSFYSFMNFLCLPILKELLYPISTVISITSDVSEYYTYVFCRSDTYIYDFCLNTFKCYILAIKNTFTSYVLPIHSFTSYISAINTSHV